jgi:hypothetical protein
MSTYVVEPGNSIAPEGTGPAVNIEAGHYYVELGIQGTTGTPSWPENYQEQFRLNEPLPDPPVVSAGPDQTVVGAYPLTVTLAGSETHSTESVTIEWTKVSGPGTVTFTDDTDPATDAEFVASGTYVLRLSVDDGRNDPVTDDVTITVTIATWKKIAFSV